MQNEKKLPKNKPKKSLLQYPLFELLSSMRFAVALLSILGIASIIGTVLLQNQPTQDYVFKFGPFWYQIFRSLGLYDVYSSAWFVVIMLFLVLSTSLCLWRNIPPFIREMRSFREKVTIKSLSRMQYSTEITGSLDPAIVEQYLQARGFQTRQNIREDGTLIAGKKGSLNKLGYIFAHVALIIICLGGLIDSNMLLKLGMLTGYIVPDNVSQFADDFKEKSRLSPYNLSFRGNVTLSEGQHSNAIFLNAGNNGALLQELPFTVELKKFHVEYYNTGMPKNFASDVIVTDNKTGKTYHKTIEVNHPFTLDGVSIYQSSFGDGGSPLTFRMWNLKAPMLAPQEIDVRSLSTEDFNFGKEKYQLIFNELKPINVQNEAEPDSQKQANFKHVLKDVHNVKQSAKDMRNVGATIRYQIRNSAGQVMDFMNYMLPQIRNGNMYYFYGSKAPDDADFHWVGIPVDDDGTIHNFMLFRQAFNDPTLIDQTADRIAQGYTTEKEKSNIKIATKTILNIFARGGYKAIDKLIEERIPKKDKAQSGEIFYRILALSSDELLTLALEQNHIKALDDPFKRGRFIGDSLQAMTGLDFYPSPVLLQLISYKQVNSSGLQMTRSPGEYLVYLGSLLLTLGAFCMFYLKERRAWVMIGDNNILFAMSASRHKRELATLFPQYVGHLQELIKDYK